MSDNIPPEIIHTNILTRLPVKSLLRFRCVCKPWLTLIDSPSFVNSHLTRNITTKSNTHVITRDKINFRSHALNDVVLSQHSDVDFEYLIDSDRQKFRELEFVGSVNGIVCLSLDTICAVDVYLWNPATRKHFMLPTITSDTGFGFMQTVPEVVSYGFGYDSVSDDFKVLRLHQIWTFTRQAGFQLRWDVRVFSLKSMSWRMIQGVDFPCPLCYDKASAVFACGGLHWLLTPERCPGQLKIDAQEILILAFDLGTEEYRLVPHPNYPYKITHLNVVDFEGSLGIVCDYGLGYYDVWIMKEYGVRESWTRLISVDQCRKPLAFSKNGKQILLQKSSDHQHLVWFDLVENKVVESGIGDMPKFYKSFVYVESLIQFHGPSKAGVKSDKGTAKKNPKKRDGFLSKGFKLVL